MSKSLYRDIITKGRARDSKRVGYPVGPFSRIIICAREAMK